ncbi:MAG: 4Fe-4S binding protein [Firmicutes bacterium]|nr:4Fe-4S binding protein [Bacillota bacterium]
MAKRKVAKITNDCINCMACASVCDFDAIREAESGEKHEVIPENCTYCQTCMGMCPVSAIIEDTVTE